MAAPVDVEQVVGTDRQGEVIHEGIVHFSIGGHLGAEGLARIVVFSTPRTEEPLGHVECPVVLLPRERSVQAVVRCQMADIRDLTIVLDRIDQAIIEVLRHDGRITYQKLSEQVHLTPRPCLERVRKLELDKFILSYNARVDPNKVGAALLVFVEITLSKTSPEDFDEFSKAVQKLEEIQECHLVSGSFDFLLKTRVANMAAYRELLGETLLRLPSVRESRTYVVMEEVKQTTFVAISS